MSGSAAGSGSLAEASFVGPPLPLQKNHLLNCSTRSIGVGGQFVESLLCQPAGLFSRLLCWINGPERKWLNHRALSSAPR
jgi:hypothetical protein